MTQNDSSAAAAVYPRRTLAWPGAYLRVWTVNDCVLAEFAMLGASRQSSQR